MPVRRSLTAAFVAVLCVVAIGPSVVAAAGPPVRVAVVVGPAGEPTDRYREQAEAAAQAARRYTTDVVTVYSPDATWPRVRRALQGASIVIYLGHGNGWPSRYSASLNPKVQNGLGLNPVEGGDDDTHQYFGESYLARDVRLASDAVVLLHHLCYASGNSEPGLPEGPLEDRLKRVDNYAAGWLRAGASAVVADALIGPAHYVKELLGRRSSVERAWRRSPSFNGHVSSFPSTRTPGYIGLVDPVDPESGFYRSLVQDEDVTSAAIRAGARGTPSALPVGPPTLVGRGIRLGAPVISGAPIAGAELTVALPVVLERGAARPPSLGLGLRWDAISLDGAGLEAQPGGTPSPSPGPSSEPRAASPSPAPTDPAADPADDLAPTIDLVRAEDPSAVVKVAAAERTKLGLQVATTLPGIPGLYRLATTIHDPDGVAYDGATQSLIPGLLIRVSGKVSAAYGVPSTAPAIAGRDLTIHVRVANTGTTPWASEPTGDTAEGGPRDVEPIPRLVARWLPLTGLEATDGETTSLPAAVAPGQEAIIAVRLRAPSQPGPSLLVLDVVTPAQGSLAALGIAPALIRVQVSPDPGPASPPPAGRG